MQRNASTTATKDAAPTLTPADDASGTLPAELRFLAAQATDPQERERIVRAYYTFAHGTPDSSTVQFALLAVALLRANLAAAQDVADHAAKFTAAARNATSAANAVSSAGPPASPEEIADAVRQALRGMADGLNRLSDQVSNPTGGWWTGAVLVTAGIVVGYALARF